MKDEFVMVPRTLDEVLAELPGGYSRDDVAYGWHECLDNMPATQPQGEPVARYSMDQTGCEELDPDGHWVRYDDMKHADPAEVERLRAELVEWKERCQRNNHEAMTWMRKHDVLRTKLAEMLETARGLTIQIHSFFGNTEHHPDCKRDLEELSHPVAALSASAERNQCDGCQVGIPVVNGAHRMGKPGGYADSMACQAAKYAGAEPSAPVERADAERYRWIEKQPYAWAVIGEAFNLPSEHDGANSLRDSIDKARAALERKP